MTHRKHVHDKKGNREVDVVAKAIRDYLKRMTPYHEDIEPLSTKTRNLFHVLYRFENNQVGQPSYPKPETWGTLKAYLGSQSTTAILEGGLPELENLPTMLDPSVPHLPQEIAPALGQLLDMEAP